MSLITPHLYLGDATNAQDKEFLRSKRIALIINCAKEIPNYFESSNPPFKYLRLNLNDFPTQPIEIALKLSSSAIFNNMSKGLVTFVHCAAGVSRSSSVVIYSIMKLHDWDLETAYRFVKDMHPKTHPNPGFVDQLIKMQDINQVPEKEINNHPITNDVHETEIITEDANAPGIYGIAPQKSPEIITSLTLDNEHPRPTYARSVKNTYAKIFYEPKS